MPIRSAAARTVNSDISARTSRIVSNHIIPALSARPHNWVTIPRAQSPGTGRTTPTDVITATYRRTAPGFARAPHLLCKATDGSLDHVVDHAVIGGTQLTVRPEHLSWTPN